MCININVCLFHNACLIKATRIITCVWFSMQLLQVIVVNNFYTKKKASKSIPTSTFILESVWEYFIRTHFSSSFSIVNFATKQWSLYWLKNVGKFDSIDPLRWDSVAWQFRQWNEMLMSRWCIYNKNKIYSSSTRL